MKIKWKLKFGYFGGKTWEIHEKTFEQVHLNNMTEKYYRLNQIHYWQDSLKKFHKRLFK
jgi:hypothetical protein